MYGSGSQSARGPPPVAPTKHEFQSVMKRSVMCKTFGLVFFIFFMLIAILMLGIALWIGLGENQLQSLPASQRLLGEEERMWIALPVALVVGCASFAIASTVLIMMVRAAVAVQRLRPPRGSSRAKRSGAVAGAGAGTAAAAANAAANAASNAAANAVLEGKGSAAETGEAESLLTRKNRA